MGQLNAGELRLVKVVRESRAYMEQLKALQKSANLDYCNLPKPEKKKYPELKALLDQYPKVMEKLRDEITIAHQLANNVQSNQMWKQAVIETFGEDGLRKCIDQINGVRLQETTTTKE